jgi:hypothetical protein
MMNLVQGYLGDMSHWNDVLSSSLSHLHLGNVHMSFPMPDDWITIGQSGQFKETNLSGDVGKWWDKVVKTGQVWAFLLGAIFGYLIKAFTTFG